MPPGVMVLVFGALAVVAIWAIRRDLRTGVSGDSIYRVRADTNPFWFAFMIVPKISGVLLCAAIILDALDYPTPRSMIKGVVGK
jgi:hypothetical protein